MSTPTEGFVPKPFDVNNLDLLAKFEKRLNPPNAIKDELGSPSRYMQTIIKSESSETSTLEDSNSNQAVNANHFRATTPNSSRSKSQFEPPTDKENSQEANDRMTSSESNHKRPIEIEQGESYEEPPGKSPKLKGSGEDNDGSRGAHSKKGTISSYFTSTNKNVINLVDGGSAPSSLFEATTKTGATLANSGSSDALNKMKSSNGSGTRSSAKDSNNGAASTAAAIQLQQQALQTANDALKKELEAMKMAKEQAENKVSRLESELKQYQDNLNVTRERNYKLMKSVEESYRKLALIEFKNKREKLAIDCVRLGKITTERTTTGVIDQWTEGFLLKELNRRTAELAERGEALKRRQKKVRDAVPRSSNSKSPINTGGAGAAMDGVSNGGSSGGGASVGAAAAAPGGANGGVFQTPTGAPSGKAPGNRRRGAGGAAAGAAGGSEEVEAAAREVYFDLAIDGDVTKAHQEQLKRDEAALAEDKRIYETEKAVHMRELKRCRSEETSRFYRELNLPTLHDRYLLQSLLGRGGFSEVWKALDLIEMREVAVKIHQLNPMWSEERKQSYIKHVTREYTIHKGMKHERIVELFDVFEIDINSFATVLEYCRGIDLDEKLKRNRYLSEKEAKIILLQVLSGLRYLNRPLAYPSVGEENENKNKKLSIIHYDLKPANILFDEMGDVKITDFGLSKIIDETDEGTSMELTSQGAGTYWYLPPECFGKGHEPARISSKVDVWSAGVIYYQMLYGARPYGEGKSQENVWSDNLIRDASPVTFPNDPKFKVSEEAKEFIRECLTKDPRQRPDILSLLHNKYLPSKF